MVIRALDSATDVIEVLGGPSSVGALTGSTYKAVMNWKSFGTFPSKTFLVMTDALKRRGHAAPARLWGMVEQGGETEGGRT